MSKPNIDELFDKHFGTNQELGYQLYGRVEIQNFATEWASLNSHSGGWVKARERLPTYYPACIKGDGGGAPFYETACDDEEVKLAIFDSHGQYDVEWLDETLPCNCGEKDKEIEDLKLLGNDCVKTINEQSNRISVLQEGLANLIESCSTSQDRIVAPTSHWYHEAKQLLK